MKKVVRFVVIIGVCIIIIVAAVLVICVNRNVNYEEIYTFARGDLKVSENLPYWFAVRDDDSQNDLFDDKQLLSQAGLEDIEDKLDTENYTYIVLNGYKLKSLQYSMRNCSLRNDFGYPIEYTGIVKANTDSEYTHIYKIKRMNIQYDYHNGSNNIEILDN